MLLSILSASFINLNPIKITKIDPINKMVLFKEGTFLINRPIPKKQAKAKRISKKIVKKRIKKKLKKIIKWLIKIKIWGVIKLKTKVKL